MAPKAEPSIDSKPITHRHLADDLASLNVVQSALSPHCTAWCARGCARIKNWCHIFQSGGFVACCFLVGEALLGKRLSAVVAQKQPIWVEYTNSVQRNCSIACKHGSLRAKIWSKALTKRHQGSGQFYLFGSSASATSFQWQIVWRQKNSSTEVKFDEIFADVQKFWDAVRNVASRDPSVLNTSNMLLKAVVIHTIKRNCMYYNARDHLHAEWRNHLVVAVLKLHPKFLNRGMT